MQLGGLVASAGINIGLVALFFSLYSIFRKQHFNVNVYFPRYVLRQRNVFRTDGFDISSLVPTAGWIQRAMQPSEDEIISACGLDGAVLLRIFIFSIRFFGICTIIGVGILAPLHYTDNQVTHSSTIEVLYDSLDLFTISNVSDGSSRLWVHLAALYAISFSAYWLLYSEFKHITEKRLQFLGTARPQPDQFTVLVRSITKSNEQQSYSASVEEFFTRYHPDKYLAHQMVIKDWKVQRMKNKLDALASAIEKLKKIPADKRPISRDGFLGIFGSKVDRLELKEREFEDLRQEHREAQKNLRNNEAELSSAFVSFKNRWSATICAQTQQAENPIEWITEWAPEPRDVYWPNLTMPLMLCKVYAVGVGVAVFLIIVTYIIPVGFVQTIAQLENLRKLLPFINVVLKIPGVKSVITGYLPSLLLSLLLYIVPFIMLFLSRVEGNVSRSGQEREAARKMFWFLVGNVFFITVLSGSLLDQISVIIEKPKEIPNQLATAVPKQATFFMTYILTTGWTGFSTEILQISVLILNFLKVRVMGNDTTLEEADAYSVPYYRAVPSVLLFILVGCMYSILAPLLLPFLLIYLVFGYVVYRNQILFVYEPAYETSGQLWTHVHGSIVFAIVLMQVMFIGVFGVKQKATAAVLTAPLPFFTLFFDNFCRSRFFPVFNNLSMEIAMKKDQDDERDGAKDELLQCIDTAYKHPAFQPIVTGKLDKGTNTELLLPGTSA